MLNRYALSLCLKEYTVEVVGHSTDLDHHKQDFCRNELCALMNTSSILIEVYLEIG